MLSYSLASSLHPSYTLLCRVDTLDRVSLQPQTVGYAALKLCSLQDGTQPQPPGPESDTEAAPETPDDTHTDSSFLNAGRFRLPLLLGRLPDWCPLTEERLEDLPVVQFAVYLSACLPSAAAIRLSLQSIICGVLFAGAQCLRHCAAV